MSESVIKNVLNIENCIILETFKFPDLDKAGNRGMTLKMDSAIYKGAADLKLPADKESSKLFFDRLVKENDPSGLKALKRILEDNGYYSKADELQIQIN